MGNVVKCNLYCCMLQKVQCWDPTGILIPCNETMVEDGLNSTMRVENITMAMASITELRKDPLYSQVNSNYNTKFKVM